jgi:hypothetical protein
MKPPPNNPEFERLTAAMQCIMSVSKADIRDKLKPKKRKPKTSASRVSATATRRAN